MSSYSPMEQDIWLPQTDTKPTLATMLLQLSLTWITQLTSESEIETLVSCVYVWVSVYWVGVCVCFYVCVCYTCESLMRKSHFLFLTPKLACLSVFLVVNHLSHIVH